MSAKSFPSDKEKQQFSWKPLVTYKNISYSLAKVGHMMTSNCKEGWGGEHF